MDDVTIAKKTMHDLDLNFVLVLKEDVLLTSKKSGILPIYEYYNNASSLFEGGSVSDRIIGKAAATLLVDLNISEIYAELISENAVIQFETNDIKVSYGKKVTNILNRTKDDLCPMEKLTLDYPTAKVLNEKIKKIMEV